MLRRHLIDVLLENPMTLKQLAEKIDCNLSEAESDLVHLMKSLKHTEFRAVVTPASCRKCEFEFSGTKLHKPSKCPQCRGTWIMEPVISVRSKQ